MDNKTVLRRSYCRERMVFGYTRQDPKRILLKVGLSVSACVLFATFCSLEVQAQQNAAYFGEVPRAAGVVVPNLGFLNTADNPSIFGAPVTLRVQADPGATGQVTFYDGTTILGSVPLAGNFATITTTLLPAGVRSLRAYYSGDGTFSAATTGVISQTVRTIAANAFLPPVGYLGSSLAVSIAGADFNGDGKQDLAVADPGNGLVYLLIGTGSGTFLRTPLYYGESPQLNGRSIQITPTTVAVGDFNGDGRPDLAVGNGEQGQDPPANVVIFLGLGNGAMQIFGTYNTLPPNLFPVSDPPPTQLAVGDFNGDGKADIAAVSDVVTILLGQGNGLFSTSLSGSQFAAGIEPSSVVVGDFNRDGKADLAVANFGDFNVSVLLGTGDGKFQAAVNYSTVARPLAMAVADFNNDGIQDLAVVNATTGKVVVLVGIGNGTFQQGVFYAAGPDPRGIAVGDFNADGLADLAVTQPNNTLQVLLGQGGAAFGPPTNYVTGEEATGGGEFLAQSFPIVVGDFNGNGKPDIVASTDFGVAILLGATNPVASTVTLSTSPKPSLLGQQVTITATVTPASDSFSGVVTFYDGTTVLGSSSAALGRAVLRTSLLASGTHLLRAYYRPSAPESLASTSSIVSHTVTNNSSNGFRSPLEMVTPGKSPQRVATGDFNADGKVDLVVTNLTDVSIFMGTGDGSFQLLRTFGVGVKPSFTAVGDFNRDGKQDLAVLDYQNDLVEIRLGLGDGTFAGTIGAAVFPAGDGPVGAVVGDFNGDGKPDLAITNSLSENVSILPGVGDGTFLAPENYPTSAPRPAFLAIGDFNGDGRPDLAVTHSSESIVTILMGDRYGTFRDGPILDTGTDPPGTGGVVVGDFNGDGKHDLAIANNGLSYVYILLGEGDGRFQSAVKHYSGNAPFGLAIEDFNGDGKQDLVTAEQRGGGASVLKGVGDGKFQGLYYYLEGTSFNAVAAADFNGDGRADFVVGTTGKLVVFLGEGTNSTVTLSTSASPSVFGERLTLTAAVTPASGASGLVTFYDGMTVLGISPVVSGQAVLRTSLLPSGLRRLRAYYRPTAAATPASTSPIIPQLVTAKPGFGFSPEVGYTVGSAPGATVTGDFNGDGKADVAVANSGSNNISVLLGTGSGAFLTAVNYPAGMQPVAIATGDFDGDGKTDLVIANYEIDSASILRGNGDGTFSAPVTFLVGSGPSSVAVADFNGDGKADLVFALFGLGYAEVYLGNGNGTFEYKALIGYGATQPFALAVGDFNGDGKADLAVSTRSGATQDEVAISLGNGDGTFVSPALRFPVLMAPATIAVGDFNWDGKDDLAIANVLNLDATTRNQVSVLLGKGNGTFFPTVNYVVGSIPSSVGLGDFNGDGNVDLVVSNSDEVSVLLGNGLGDFSPAVSYKSGSSPNSVVVGDFNGDGRADLAVANSPLGKVTILLATASGTNATLSLSISPNSSLLGQQVTLTAALTPAGNATDSVTFYDGMKVLGSSPLASGQAVFRTSLLVSGTRSLRAYYGGMSAEKTHTVTVNPGAGFQTASNFAAGMGPISVGKEDFNGDGKQDLAVANVDGNNVRVLLGNGSGGFQAGANYGVGLSPLTIAVGDFNRDGRADLVTANVDGGNVSVLLGTANGTFQIAVHYPAGSMPYSVAVGDFNGDGKPDLAVANSAGANLSVLLGTGDGTFQAAVNYAAGTDPEFIVVGDFNADGKADLAVANYGINRVNVLLGTGTGTFQAPVPYGTAAGPSSIGIGDFNADGKFDLAVANYDGNNVSVLLGAGNGTFQPASQYAVGTHAYSIVVADINGDGKPDLAVANSGDESVSVLLGAGNGTFQAAVKSGAGSKPTWVAAGEFNGDGRVDLAVANFGSNDISILLGQAPIQSGTLPTIRSTSPVEAAFQGKAGFSSNTYVEIHGTNLAPLTRTWQGRDFSGPNAPTSLDGVSVTVNGKPAFIYFISPDQININTPEDTVTGAVSVQVKTPAGLSNIVFVDRTRLSPTLHSDSRFAAGGRQYVVALTPDFSSFIGKPGLLAGVVFNTAKPGDTVSIYVLGAGPTNPPTQAGIATSQSSPLALPHQMRIGGVPATLRFAGAVTGTIGLYQFNVVIPAVAAGDQLIELIVDGIANNQNLFITVGP